MSSTRMKRKFLGVIDPTDMKKREERLAVGHYLASHGEAFVLPKNKRCNIEIKNKKTGTTRYGFEFNHKVMHGADEPSSEVEGKVKLGKGSFGKVKPIVGRLTSTSKGSATFMPSQPGDEWVAKKISQQAGVEKESFLEDIQKEYFLAEKTPHLFFQPLIACQNPRYPSLETCYVRMPYFKGPTLKEIIDSKKPLKIDDIITLCLNLALSLQWMFHDRKLIHRDLKPANVIISKSYQAAIVDVGLAKEVGEETSEYAGTIYYMAPEQINDSETTPATDVYALGKMYAALWHLLTGTLYQEECGERHTNQLEAIILAGDAVYDTTEFDKLRGISKEHKQIVLEMIQSMTLFSDDKRKNLDEIIATWDKIRLERKLAHLPKRKHVVTKRDHIKAIVERDFQREAVRKGERILFKN